jgi:membrane-bound metal-dependent hydrolase YbcI (DUF457 family)
MPSPLGHALAGLAVAWSAEAMTRMPLGWRAGSTIAVTCAALAIGPDVDWVYPPVHRMMTHSLFATGLVFALAAGIGLRRRPTRWKTAAVCAAAYGSHLLLDWLGGDTKVPAGIQLLWPLDHKWFISDVSVFRATDIGGFFQPRVMISNALAVLGEVAVLLPLALLALFWRRRRLQTRVRHQLQSTPSQPGNEPQV